MVTGLVFLLIAVAIGGSVVLYLLVRGEATKRRVMDREAAERAARRDVDDDVSDRR